ncbi:MAG TPA: acyltransferase, partial [Hellea balneolensis]|nr:acyltransferase [Hellea balneolensis]
MHIVEELIAERVPRLRSHPFVWKALRPVLYRALGYDQAVRMADAVAGLSGFAAFDHISRLLALRPDISGLEHIPRSGPVLVIANHPTGLADGVFVFDALKSVRPDHIFMANADALRVVPGAGDIIIPVEWVKAKRTPAKTRQTLKDLKAVLGAGRAVVIFPSGVLARMSLKGLVDKAWNPTAVSMA